MLNVDANEARIRLLFESVDRLSLEESFKCFWFVAFSLYFLGFGNFANIQRL